MSVLQDYAIGTLTYEYGWVRDYAIEFFGDLVVVQLVVPCDEGDDIEDAQRTAFSKFNANKDFFTQQAEVAIFEHYLNICGELREQFGIELADKLAPVVTEKAHLKSLVTPVQVVIQQTFDSGNRVVGLLFTCSWEPELGLAVKFIDEKIDEVGPQDIVI